MSYLITKEQLKQLVSICANEELLYEPIISAIEEAFSLSKQTFTVYQVVWVL